MTEWFKGCLWCYWIMGPRECGLLWRKRVSSRMRRNWPCWGIGICLWFVGISQGLCWSPLVLSFLLVLAPCSDCESCRWQSLTFFRFLSWFRWICFVFLLMSLGRDIVLLTPWDTWDNYLSRGSVQIVTSRSMSEKGSVTWLTQIRSFVIL